MTQLDHVPASTGRPALDPALRIRLSLMMLLQYATWGAWFSVLSKYLVAIGFTNLNIGAVYGVTAVASMISPLIFGQIADRWVPVQYLLAFLHLAGAALLAAVCYFQTFTGLYVCALGWALCYMPTLSLTNALSFHHLVDVDRHFPSIRVFGTIGWILAGVTVGVFGLKEDSVQPLVLGAALSALLGLYCLTLPHTPPAGKSGTAFPPLQALGMLRDPSYALFIVVSFAIAIVLSGYFVFTGPFLAHVGTVHQVEILQKAAPVMTIGQFSEMIFLPILPFFLKQMGIRWILSIGIAAWALRYGLFSIGTPALVIAGVALHGICYDFFFVAAYMYTDGKAPREIRASAQALVNFVVLGVGWFLGTLAFGWLRGYVTVNEQVDYAAFWRYPAIGAAIVLAFFLLGFRESKKPPVA